MLTFVCFVHPCTFFSMMKATYYLQPLVLYFFLYLSGMSYFICIFDYPCTYPTDIIVPSTEILDANEFENNGRSLQDSNICANRLSSSFTGADSYLEENIGDFETLGNIHDTFSFYDLCHERKYSNDETDCGKNYSLRTYDYKCDQVDANDTTKQEKFWTEFCLFRLSFLESEFLINNNNKNNKSDNNQTSNIQTIVSNDKSLQLVFNKYKFNHNQCGLLPDIHIASEYSNYLSIITKLVKMRQERNTNTNDDIISYNGHNGTVSFSSGGSLNTARKRDPKMTSVRVLSNNNNSNNNNDNDNDYEQFKNNLILLNLWKIMWNFSMDAALYPCGSAENFDISTHPDVDCFESFYIKQYWHLKGKLFINKETNLRYFDTLDKFSYYRNFVCDGSLLVCIATQDCPYYCNVLLLLDGFDCNANGGDSSHFYKSAHGNAQDRKSAKILTLFDVCHVFPHHTILVFSPCHLRSKCLFFFFFDAMIYFFNSNI